MPVGPSHRSRGFFRSVDKASKSSRLFSGGTHISFFKFKVRRNSSLMGSNYGDDYGQGEYVPSTKHQMIRRKKERITFFSILTAIACILLVIGISMLATNIPTMKSIEKDSVEYAKIIQKAKNGDEGYYLFTVDNIRFSYVGLDDRGDVYYHSTSKLNLKAYEETTYKNIRYFYIVATFIDAEGRQVTGETYTMYTIAQIKSMEEITFAYTKDYDGDGAWDVVDVNYSLDKNINYFGFKTNMTVGIVVLGIALVLVAIFVYGIIRTIKNLKFFKNEPIYREKITYKKKKLCAYCGTVLESNEKKCPNCGSTVLKTIDDHSQVVKKEYEGADIVSQEEAGVRRKKERQEKTDRNKEGETLDGILDDKEESLQTVSNEDIENKPVAEKRVIEEKPEATDN